MKVMMKTVHCFFFWMRDARLRERTSFGIRTRKKADGGRPTLKETRSSEADPQTQFCKQLSKVVDFQTYDRRRMVAPGHFVVETNGKQCDVWQEGAR